MEYALSYVKEQPLFDYKDAGGVQIDLNLKLDSGLNTEAMRSSSDLTFDHDEKNLNSLSYLEEMSDIQLILDELIELTKAGNHLAAELYNKIKEKLEGISFLKNNRYLIFQIK